MSMYPGILRYGYYMLVLKMIRLLRKNRNSDNGSTSLPSIA